MISKFIKDIWNHINDMNLTLEEKFQLIDLLADDNLEIEETVINGRKALVFG